MADDDTTLTPNPDSEGSPETGTPPTSEAPDPAKVIEDSRKRQAGAEAARQAAERKFADAEKELAGYRAANQSASEKDLTELAKVTERLTAAEKRAEEAEAKAEARILDARFPSARKELPEVTDEVRLAKFEAMLADDNSVTYQPPVPTGGNPPRTPNSGSKALEDMSVKELEAHLATFSRSAFGLSD